MVAAASNGSQFGGYIYTWQVPPRLNVTSPGSSLLLSWPSSTWPYVLQQNSDLTTTNWLDVTAAATLTNGYFQWTAPPLTGNGFYRLRSR
jgi:hypothetical protein